MWRLCFHACAKIHIHRPIWSFLQHAVVYKDRGDLKLNIIFDQQFQYIRHRVQTGSGAHSPSYSQQKSGRSSSDQVKNVWSCTSTSPCLFMVWSMQHREGQLYYNTPVQNYLFYHHIRHKELWALVLTQRSCLNKSTKTRSVA